VRSLRAGARDRKRRASESLDATALPSTGSPCASCRICPGLVLAARIYPGHTNRLHESFEDPVVVQGSKDEHLAAFRRARDQSKTYLLKFPANAS
jgi:hypothetical protein